MRRRVVMVLPLKHRRRPTRHEPSSGRSTTSERQPTNVSQSASSSDVSPSQRRNEGQKRTGAQPLDPRRRILFIVLATVVLPIVLLTIVEVALRLGGYGYHTDFFKPLRDRETRIFW